MRSTMFQSKYSGPLPLLVALAAGCVETGVRVPDAAPASAPDAMPSPSCIEAAEHSDLEWLEENVFTPSCAAFSACHRGRALSAGGLNLEAGRVLDSLLDQPSLEFPSERTLVVAGDPATSYLMVVIGAREDPEGLLPEAGTMPFNNPLLCKPKRDAIERWILGMSDPVDAGQPDGGDLDAGPDDAMPADAM